ncbi:MAG: ATP-binding protein, partial [Alcaligenaceae bacterium]
VAGIAASRHHLVYGRRGVGKTALLLEVKRLVEERGNIAVWTNAHVIRHQDAESAFATVINAILLSIVQRSGTSSSDAISRIESLRAELEGDGSSSLAVSRIAEINRVLRSILRVDVLQLFVFLDDFYLLPASVQPQLLDYIAAALRDCDGWMKIASIERLTKSFEHSSRIGLEIPHDAVKVDLDVTLEDPKSAQTFLETVLNSYTSTAGISSHTKIAKTQALGRLILASGGVPRDYLNLFATSIVVARESRSQAAEIGKEDVAGAAGRFARSKKRDLEQDVDGAESASLLKALELLSSTVKGEKYTYFRVELSKKSSPGYEVLARLVDLRFVHLVQSSLSDQHLAGKKYEAYIIALSEYTDVRLQRGLNVLDIEHGSWVWQLTGKAGTSKLLAGTQLRDRLRQAPILDLDTLVSTV